MKKILALSLSVILIAFTFCACDTKKSFASNEEFKTYVDGIWEEIGTDGSHSFLLISNGTINFYSPIFVKSSLREIDSNEYDLKKLSFDKFYDDIFVKFESNRFYTINKNVDYNYKKSMITYEDGNIKKLSFLESGQAKEGDRYFNKIFDDATAIKSIVKKEFEVQQKEIIFKTKYADLPSGTDVKYDKYKYFGDNFMITGIAELDDYYNWGYKNYEYGYFCISIGDWYVYANRNEFSDLYEELKNWSRELTVVAQMVYVDTGSSNMATLIDYKKANVN